MMESNSYRSVLANRLRVASHALMATSSGSKFCQLLQEAAIEIDKSSEPESNDAKDAARYRWLRMDPATRTVLDGNIPWTVRVERVAGVPTMEALHGIALDADIDCRMAQERNDATRSDG